jgi:hypothetical protein
MMLHDLAAAAGVATALAAPHAQLRIAETGSFAGPATYHLVCGPAGGTLPRRARACRALRRHPELLLPRAAGQPFPCPFGLPNFHVSGRYAGGRVDATFGACLSGQAQLARRWAALVPSAAARLRVAPGRGIGLLRLGERERRVRGLLGAGRATRRGVFYPSGMSIGYGAVVTIAVGFTVAYRTGHAIAIASNNPATTIAGRQLSDGFGALRRRLHGWRRCGPRALARGAGPSTTVTFARSRRSVTVRSGPAAGCAVTATPGRRALTRVRGSARK